MLKHRDNIAAVIYSLMRSLQFSWADETNLSRRKKSLWKQSSNVYGEGRRKSISALSNYSKKKTKNLTKKWTKNSSRQFIKQDILMGNKHMKRCSALLVIMGMKRKQVIISHL